MMFGFNLSEKNPGSRKEMSTGVQLLASMLVCYPELYSVTYEPRDTEITLDFVVKGKMPKAEMEEFATLLDKSLQLRVSEDAAPGHISKVLVGVHLQRIGQAQWVTHQSFGVHLGAFIFRIKSAAVHQRSCKDQGCY